jgi:hypothetical protein
VSHRLASLAGLSIPLPIVRGLLNVKAVTSVDRPICVHARRASAEPADDDVARAHRLETELFHRTRR